MSKEYNQTLFDLGRLTPTELALKNELSDIKSAVRRFFNAKSIKEFLETQKEMLELIGGKL